MNDINTAKILNTRLSTEKISAIRKKIIKSLKDRSNKFYIVTPNPELIMLGLADKEYQRILNQAQFSIPDGVGVLMAGKILKKGIKGRLPGVDFMQELVRECAKEALTVGFFGAAPGVAEKTADCLHKSYPNLKVGFVGSKWGDEGFRNAEKYQAQITNNSQFTIHKSPITTSVDILFVALGSPKQERWIAKNLPNLPVTAMMGVGGSFDFISGRVKRAPVLIRKMGFEWLFRLIIQPWRIKRQMVLLKFAYLVLKDRFKR